MRRLLLSVIFAVACSRGPEPCASAGTCPDGQECMANRCVVAGGDPVPADSQRLVVEPEALAVVEGRERAPTELPASVTFGSSAGTTATFYLRFPDVWRDKRRIEAAFVILEPMPATFGSNEDVAVDAWRVGARWEPRSLSLAEQPELTLPRGRGIARSAPPGPLRIDVTALVRHSAKNAASDHGIALRASPGDAAGASFATGVAGGRSPRLEIYVR
ncbi:MAG: hypothetical protein HYZ29_34745 [Myxococcales bacterium]|nr:hypothetical protein [Myxococcales bacterium]